MSFNPFPSIPAFPGVPPLPRLPSLPGAISTVLDVLLGADDPSAIGSSSDPVWGIYDQSGNPVAIADSFVAFEYDKEYALSNYPVEQGGFETYNKVEKPFSQRVTLAKAGAASDRAGFLDAIFAATDGLDLFTVVTPDHAYLNANIFRNEITRQSSKGVELLLVDLTLQEIRTSVVSTFTNTQNPASAAPVSGGTVQPQDPTPTQAQAAAGGAG
jgi:hypothetical protein